MTSDDVKFPFGKYKGQTVVDIAQADPGYLSWVTAQQNLRDGFPTVIEAIDALNGGTDSTPEHNRIQAAFLDEDFALAALGPLFDEITETTENTVLGTISRMDSFVEPPADHIYLKGCESDPSKAVPISDTKQIMEKLECTPSSYFSFKIDKPVRTRDVTLTQYKTCEGECDFKENCEVTGFEVFCDVTLEYTYTFSFPYKKHKTDIKIVSKYIGDPCEDRHHTYDAKWDSVITLEKTTAKDHVYHSNERAEILGVEIKPTIGDEYPAIMRQMSAQRKLAGTSGAGHRKIYRNPWSYHVLYTRDNVSNLSDEKLTKMFAVNDIYLIIDRESDLP